MFTQCRSFFVNRIAKVIFTSLYFLQNFHPVDFNKTVDKLLPYSYKFQLVKIYRQLPLISLNAELNNRQNTSIFSVSSCLHSNIACFHQFYKSNACASHQCTNISLKCFQICSVNVLFFYLFYFLIRDIFNVCHTFNSILNFIPAFPLP